MRGRTSIGNIQTDTSTAEQIKKQSSMWKDNAPMIQRIMKKGMKRAVKTVISDSSANPL